MTFQEALRNHAVPLLTAAGVPSAERDARALLSGATGVPRDRMTLHLHDTLEVTAFEAFDRLVQLRCARRPVSQILGNRAFFGRDFKVTSDVLDPRPETETLVLQALQSSFDDVLDLGTGSGAILLTLLAERPTSRGLGTDLSPQALGVARQNAEAFEVSHRCRFAEGAWFTCVEGTFDLIVSNPPYIARDEMAELEPELGFEPRMALTDEADGLTAYRAIASGARDHLRPGGYLLVEIGPTQAAAVSQLIAEAGFEAILTHKDLDGRDRVVGARAPET